jgi:hypothetical protein
VLYSTQLRFAAIAITIRLGAVVSALIHSNGYNAGCLVPSPQEPGAELPTLSTTGIIKLSVSILYITRILWRKARSNAVVVSNIFFVEKLYPD